MFVTSFLRSLVEQPAMPALFVAVGGWGFAWLWFDDDRRVIGIILVAALFVIGGVADLAGRTLVRSKPVRARRLMEMGILAPAAVAIFVGGLLIVFGVQFEPSPTTTGGTVDPETKALAAAFVAAITTFGTVMWVKGAEDADGTWLADRVKSEFQTRWVDCFPNDSLAAEALYSEQFGSAVGWGWKARRVRIDQIQASAVQATCPSP
jgi:hypothetical protein